MEDQRLDQNTWLSMFPHKEIPRDFYSFSTGAPFIHCVQCHGDLQSPDCVYIIEKAYRKFSEFDAFDVLYEFAMCIDCAQAMQQDLSRESQQHIEHCFEHIDWDKREEELSAGGYFDHDRYLNNCLLSGEEKDALTEYVIYGRFHGDQMIYNIFPYMLSGQALSDISEGVSQETMDELDRFREDLLGPPPELKKLLKSDFILV